ncbi:MAG: flagellar hook capping FlgD N-terminal domain-containing protein [Thermodesulfobacteriota bacterium]
MSEVNANSAAAFSGSSGLGARSNSAANLGKDDFLKLLAVQLQYQDPLKPMENTEFIAQMAQFSTLEGITNMNVSLQDMSGQVLSMNNLSTTELIGRKVKVYGDNVTLINGQSAQVDYLLHHAAANVEISIVDSNGVEVRKIEAGGKEAGVNSFIWDGTDNLGKMSVPGEYHVSINATTEDDIRVIARPITTNLVEGVTYENGVPYLMIQGSMVSLSDILEVWGN